MIKCYTFLTCAQYDSCIGINDPNKGNQISDLEQIKERVEYQCNSQLIHL